MLININLNEGDDCSSYRSLTPSLLRLILTLPLKCSLTLFAASHSFPPDLVGDSVQLINALGIRLHIGHGTRSVGSGWLTMPQSQGAVLNKNRSKSVISQRHARSVGITWPV